MGASGYGSGRGACWQRSGKLGESSPVRWELEVRFFLVSCGVVKGLEAEGVALDDDDGEHVKRAGGMRAR